MSATPQRWKPGAEPRRRASGGFTLLEISLVVAMLGVLASAAQPAFMRYIYQSRRAEALYALRTIHDLQTTFYGKDMEYSDSFAELGFKVEGGRTLPDGSVQGRYYTYSLDTWDLGQQRNANYRATATGDIDPSDGVMDVIIIENRLTVKD